MPLGFPAVRARTVFGASFYDSDVWVQGRRQRTGLEARWQPGRVSIQSEYIRLTDERRGQSVEDGDLSPLVAHGWYVSGTYALTRKRNRFGRIEVAVRYETLSFGSKGRAGEPSTSARADAVLGNSRSCHDARRQLARQPVGEGAGEPHPRGHRAPVDGPDARALQLLEPGIPFTTHALRANA